MKNGIKIVIDAGHGGIDGGVVGMDGKTKESTLNLYISKILANELSRKGYIVTMTRKTDSGLYQTGATNKKLSDMQKRKQIINEVAPSLVISIHQNYYPSKSVSGAQVFYSDKQEKSKEYAEKMQSSLNGFLSQNKQSKLADYYILQCSVYPTMLIECGFVSNASDLKNLLNPSYRERFSREIARVVDEILLNPR
jgi:N-acetylmuramoyl-L-alanine amidase